MPARHSLHVRAATATSLLIFVVLFLFALTFPTSLPFSDLSAGPSPDDECRRVHYVQDQCSFITTQCTGEDGSAFYLDLFYCQLEHVKPIGLLLLVSWLCLLFLTISIAASDFFCPNLNTISRVLGISESISGVTFLAFANGSPDLFSTFAAFSTNSGSLAMGELFGAACFITTVVAGSMALIKPFKVHKKPFMRDALFFMLSVCVIGTFLSDGKLKIWECILIVCLYACYVVLVVTWSRWVKSEDDGKRYSVVSAEDPGEDEEASASTMKSRSSSGEDSDVKWPPLTPIEDEERGRRRQSVRMSSRRNTLVAVPPISMVGALEFQSVVKSFRRPRNVDDGDSPSPIWSRRLSHQTLFHADNQAQAQTRPRLQRSATSGGPMTAPPDQTAPFWRERVFPTSPHMPGSDERAESRSPKAPKAVKFAFPDKASSPSRHEPSPQASPRSRPTTKALPRLDIPAQMRPLTPSPLGRSMESSSPLNEASAADTVEPPESDEDEEMSERPWCWPKVFPPLVDVAWEFVPTLVEWDHETPWEKFHAIIAVPSLFLLLITVPSPYIEHEKHKEDAGEDDMKQPTGHYGSLAATSPTNIVNGSRRSSFKTSPWKQPMFEPEWSRWVTCIWCFGAPIFTLLSFWLQSDETTSWLLKPLLITLGVSIVLFALVQGTTTGQQAPPAYRIIIALAGFAVSIAWISLIAAQVVGALKALAIILNMSDAIMGLTIFAMAASLGDFVANTTIAKMGFPIMGFAACFGGPMLNIMLGIGLSGTYVLAKAGHTKSGITSYEFDIDPTLVVSGVTVVLTLIGLLIAVPANGWHMDRKIGWGLIAVWCISTIVSVVLEVTGVKL